METTVEIEMQTEVQTDVETEGANREPAFLPHFVGAAITAVVIEANLFAIEFT